MRVTIWIKKYQRDLSGKTYVITGANSGIGFEASKMLASFGAHIIMACRNQNKAEEAIAMIKSECPSAHLSYLHYDQASFTSIDNFVQSLKNVTDHLDGVVFNAGIYHPRKDLTTVDGFPLTMGTNYFGTVYLLRALIRSSWLTGPDEKRLVFVGSFVWRTTSIRKIEHQFSRANLPMQRQYNYSKTLIGVLAYHLMKNRQLDDNHRLGNNVKVALMHPGVSPTNIVNADAKGFSKAFSRLAHAVLYVFVHHPPKAALGITKALVSDAARIDQGVFAPRGLFQISGTPKLIKYPPKVVKVKPTVIQTTLTIIDKKTAA